MCLRAAAGTTSLHKGIRHPGNDYLCIMGYIKNGLPAVINQPLSINGDTLMTAQSPDTTEVELKFYEFIPSILLTYLTATPAPRDL